MNTVERIKSMCKERKIAISKLEKACGFVNGYIGQLRKGTVPDDRLVKIADYFNVSVDYLMTGKEPEISDDIVLEEIELLDMYRKLTPEQKENIVTLMRLFTKGK